MSDFDKFDQQILQELQKDCTISMDQLSERIGLSRNAVWRRVSMLENSGVIRARVAILDAQKLSRAQSVIVQIRASKHSDYWLRKFKATVESFPEIQSAYRMSGDLDYLLKVRVADVASYDRFYKALINRLEIEDISASFVMEELKETTAFPV